MLGTRSLPSFCGGGPLLLESMPEREQGCYNNTEKLIFLLVVCVSVCVSVCVCVGGGGGGVGGLGYVRVAVVQDCIHLYTVSDENV